MNRQTLKFDDRLILLPAKSSAIKALGFMMMITENKGLLLVEYRSKTRGRVYVYPCTVDEYKSLKSGGSLGRALNALVKDKNWQLLPEGPSSRATCDMSDIRTQAGALDVDVRAGVPIDLDCLRVYDPSIDPDTIAPHFSAHPLAQHFAY